MSFISEIFAGGAEGVFKGVKEVVGAFKADPLEVAKIEAAIAQTELNVMLGLSQAQNKVNELQAASSDKFASRARPAIMWICGVSLGYAVVGWSFLNWTFAAITTYSGHVLPELPPPDTTLTFDLLLGMLGLGGMRSFDKMRTR